MMYYLTLLQYYSKIDTVIIKLSDLIITCKSPQIRPFPDVTKSFGGVCIDFRQDNTNSPTSTPTQEAHELATQAATPPHLEYGICD